jgi:uncharacterized protein YbjT (DUF2867 family)
MADYGQTILLTGATGQVGGAAFRALAGTPVRVLARTPDAVDAAGDVDVVLGSFDEADSLRRALDGVDVLFLTGRDNPDQVEQHLRVLEVAATAGVGHVVKLSAIGARPDSPVALMRWHASLEAVLRDSAFAWTFLRPHLSMQNLLRFAGDVASEGRLAAPMGAGAFPLVDTRDVGAAVAAVLRSPADHAGATYALTGPSAVTYADVAAALSELVGTPVRYEPLDPQAFSAGLLDAGIPAWRADDLAAIASAYTAADNTPSDDLERLLGRPATPLSRFLADHRGTYLAGASRSHL